MEFRVKRCRHLHIEPREDASLDVRQLFNLAGKPAPRRHWVAIAPHLNEEVGVSEQELLVLGAVGPTHWQSSHELDVLGAEVLGSLIEKGLLISDRIEDQEIRRRDSFLRTSNWWTPALVAWSQSRWEEIDAVTGSEGGTASLDEMIERFGAPPEAVFSRGGWTNRVRLGKPSHSDFDELLARRTTTRNFDPNVALGSGAFSQMMYRAFGATHRQELAEGAEALKRSSPSGGGLHPIEAYVLVADVEGLEPGIYHYHCVDHAMEMSRCLDQPEARKLALSFVAGQHWFADAAVFVILAVRFERHQWKYRNHPKAYRVLNIEAGHFSQTLYLSAADLGLGAFVTVAINEKEIEAEFEFDGLEQGCLAVCGFGPQSKHRTRVEYDPERRQWVRE